VFEKLGYDPEAGVEIFNSVCESLVNKKTEESRDRARSGDYTDERKRSVGEPSAAVAAPPESLKAEVQESFFEGGEYRMDLDDFITAAVEVDDSLIQAIQLVTRKKIFRMLKQRGNSIAVPQLSGSSSEQDDPPSPMDPASAPIAEES
jgi:hypothetical protein